jgi:hypothetical protein
VFQSGPWAKAMRRSNLSSTKRSETRATRERWMNWKRPSRRASTLNESRSADSRLTTPIRALIDPHFTPYFSRAASSPLLSPGVPKQRTRTTAIKMQHTMISSIQTATIIQTSVLQWQRRNRSGGEVDRPACRSTSLSPSMVPHQCAHSPLTGTRPNGTKQR